MNKNKARKKIYDHITFADSIPEDCRNPWHERLLKASVSKNPLEALYGVMISTEEDFLRRTGQNLMLYDTHNMDAN